MTKLSETNFEVKFENVTRAYSGRVGCMCGCNGTYRTADSELIEHDEFSPRAVRIRTNKILRCNPDEVEVLLTESGVVNCAYHKDNGRMVALYFQ